MTIEIEVFHEIFEEFACLEDHVQDDAIWMSNSIIKLMSASKGIEDKPTLEESLINILILCKFREDGYLQDSYISESYSNDLMDPDKNILEAILRAEFI